MELKQGTLDLLILRILLSGKRHGYGIVKRIQVLSNESLNVGQGSMYPALHRLERKGWVKAKREETDKGKVTKFYELTSRGREQVEKEKEEWHAFVSVINTILEEG